MKTILIDIPQQEVFFVLDADQWYAFEAWLSEKGIPFGKHTPSPQLPVSDEETLIAYRIEANEKDVLAYFEEREMDSNSSATQ